MSKTISVLRRYPQLALFISVSSAIVAAILITYGHNLGDISHLSADWSAFGSLLAGCFTLLASGATIATLWFLIFQHEENKPLTNLEKYHKHGKLFFEFVDWSEEATERRIKIVNKLGLYNRIFANNSLSTLSLTSSNSQGLLHDVDKTLNELANYIIAFDSCCDRIPCNHKEKVDRRYDCIELVDKFFKAYRLFQSELITFKVTQQKGDIHVADQNIGLNLFSFPLDLDRLTSLINTIYQFSGNKQFEKPELEHIWEFKCVLYYKIIGTPGYYSMYAGNREDILPLFMVLYYLFNIQDIKEIEYIATRIHFMLSNEKSLYNLEDSEKLRYFIGDLIADLEKVVKKNKIHEDLESIRQARTLLAQLRDSDTIEILKATDSPKFFPTFIK